MTENSKNTWKWTYVTNEEIKEKEEIGMEERMRRGKEGEQK